MLPTAARGIPGAESPVPDNGGPNLWQPAHGAHLVGGRFSSGKLFVFNLTPNEIFSITASTSCACRTTRATSSSKSRCFWPSARAARDSAWSRYTNIGYTIRLIGASHIAGSPFLRSFLPGAIDARRSRFIRPASTVICCAGAPTLMHIEPRDEFGNSCLFDQNQSDEALQVRK